MKRIFAGVSLACLLAAAPVGAAELKLGGYVASPAGDKDASLAVKDLPGPDTGAMTMSFTPRGSGSFYGSGESAEGLSFAMGLDSHWASTQRLDAMGFDYDREDKDEMMLGGALLLDDVRLTGGIGRTKLFGAKADLIAAGFTYGPLSARVLLGEGEDTTVAQRDIMVLSTDLKPWSWLSLQGDVAVTEQVGSDRQAIGRLGVELHF